LVEVEVGVVLLLLTLDKSEDLEVLVVEVVN